MKVDSQESRGLTLPLVERSPSLNLRPSGPNWTTTPPPHGIAKDFALPGANVFGFYLETRPSAPQCATVRPKQHEAGQIFGQSLVSAVRGGGISGDWLVL